jgi:predicted ATP-dependent serine protease
MLSEICWNNSSRVTTPAARRQPQDEQREAAPIEWLVPDWIPPGKLVVLDGDPGLGKSTLLLKRNPCIMSELRAT